MMKRYALFLIIALALHGLLLLPFVHWFNDEGAAPGGGEGGSIHISIMAAPPATPSTGWREEVSDAERPRSAQALSKRQDPAHASADASSHVATGRGVGDQSGPSQGLGSGTTGQNEVLAKIRQQIEAAKHYPLLARRRGVEGTAAVSFQINADGSVSGLRLRQSSGASLLDQAAIKTIERAAPFPAYPDPIQIGIRFALNEEPDM